MSASKNFCLFDGKKWRMNIKMFDILVSSVKHNNRFLHLPWIVQKFIVQMFMTKYKETRFFILLN